MPHRHPDPMEDVASPYAVWVKDSLEVAFDQVRRHSGKAVRQQKQLYDQRAVRRLFGLGDWVMRYYPAGKKCKLDSIWAWPYLIVATLGWTVGIQRHLTPQSCWGPGRAPNPTLLNQLIFYTIDQLSPGPPPPHPKILDPPRHEDPPYKETL